MALSYPRAARPGLPAPGPLLRHPATLALGGVLLGLLGGVAVVQLGPLLPLLVLVGAVGGALVLVEPRWGLLGALGVITLLPFGTLPFKVGITPTLLTCALALTWLVFALRLLLHRDELLLPTRLDTPLVLFLIVTLFAFILGIGRGYTTQTIHDYGKMVISISLYFLVINLIRDRRDFALALNGLGLLGLALYGVIIVILAIHLRPPLVGRAVPDGAEAEATLALSGALVAALAAGVLDHYFFNIVFSHMVALFWGLVALAIVAARLTRESIAQP